VIQGIHHITAIAGSAQGNYDFYTGVMGLRLVKRTVNFDDPGTYHFYYGDEQGTPGTILTFFPWQGAYPGVPGTGMATEIGYSVPKGSLAFWEDRLKTTSHAIERMGEVVLPIHDPEGLRFNLIESKYSDHRTPWATGAVPAENATRGFHSVTLTVKSIKPTAAILTGIFGYELIEQEGNRYRYLTMGSPTAAIIDLIEEPTVSPGRSGTGTNHHVAFRVANEQVQQEYYERILREGLQITPRIDRDYFYSMYFREPGGVLFELATDNPGFTVDEPLQELGTHLMLPEQYEPQRASIEKHLPKVRF
jgi:glyoxalase family protein